MKKYLTVCLAILLSGYLTILPSCSSSSSDESGGGNAAALEYATFGVALNNVIPDGLKMGGVTADISTFFKALSGSCASEYTDCPYLTAEGGGDSNAGEILMRLWALDYQDACTDELLADGTCFDCVDCQTGDVETTKFIRPTMLSDPESCGTTSTAEGKYANGSLDPCFFDAMIAQIGNVEECETVRGGMVDISTVVPWYASWGLSQTVRFSSYYSTSSGGVWWTVNSGESGEDQYFLSLDSNWLYMGSKDATNDKFLFFASSSPAYNEGMGESGGENINIGAYYGPLSTITKTFEIIQIRDQSAIYIERMKTNEDGTYLWYQQWYNERVPQTPEDVDAVKDAPDYNRCVQIGDAVVLSKYVPFQDCVDAFGKLDIDDLNLDSNFVLKIVDIQTAAGTDFSGALTPTIESSCLEEEGEEGEEEGE